MTQNDIAAAIKRCNRCHEHLPRASFNANPNFRDGLHGHCRDCQAEVLRECEAIIADREKKLTEKAGSLSAEERERLRLRNLQYRRKYLEKKKALRDQSTERSSSASRSASDRAQGSSVRTATKRRS